MSLTSRLALWYRDIFSRRNRAFIESHVYRGCRKAKKRIKANVADLFLKCTNRRSFLVGFFSSPKIFCTGYLSFLSFFFSLRRRAEYKISWVCIALVVSPEFRFTSTFEQQTPIYIYIPKHRPPKKPPRHSIHPSPTTRKANCITSCTFRSLR